jgi:hypothetical protein
MECRMLAMFALTLGASACAAPPQVACTMEARSTFAVTVVDSVSGGNLAPDATVRVTEGSFSDTLAAPAAGATAYSGVVYERPGVYDVSVTHPAYAPWQESGVRVERDECHVITYALTARLRLQP